MNHNVSCPRDRSTSRSRSNHHDRPAQSQYINNNFSLQFDCRSNESHPTDRTHNNNDRGHDSIGDSYRHVQQQRSNSYNDYQNCTSHDNSDRRISNENDGYPGYCNSIPGTPHGNSLGHECITGLQSGTPHGISQSGSEPNGNNLILSGTAHANRLSNGTPMLADTTTTSSRTTETPKRRKKGTCIVPMIPSTYVPTMVEETNAFTQLKSCYSHSGSSAFDVNSNLPSWLPFVDSPLEIVNKIHAVDKATPEVVKHHNLHINGDDDNDDDADSDSDYSAPFGDCIMSNVHDKEIKTFMRALPNNIVLSLGFNYQGQNHQGIHCPCSKIMRGWRESNGISSDSMFMGESVCANKAYSPQSILKHLKRHQKSSSFHY